MSSTYHDSNTNKTWLNILSILVILLFSNSYSNAQVWTHDFETAGGYTTSSAECTDAADDYFIRTDGSNINDAPTSPQGTFYFSAQDIDAAGCPAITGANGTLDFDNIDISSCSGLTLEVLAAAFNGAGWDDNDYVHIFYDIDNTGTWSNLIWIENDGTPFNSSVQIDTDFDGTGDGAILNPTFQNISGNISGTGALIDIRIEFQLNSGSEDINIDNLRIFGTGCGTPPVTITTGAITGSPFNVDCTNTVTDAGSVAFTSVGTFNAGNVYTAQLSDATGSFASPIDIGTLTSTANSGTINFILPSTLPTGAGYMIQIVSSNPSVTGTSNGPLTITQAAPCVAALPSSQGLLINEWSNGASGSKEYYEFVVAGQCGDLVDIRGYILDDNNGTFSTVFPSTSGIAQGHLRLTNDAQWASIPVGSLIVIYNADDVNANFAAATPSGPIADDLTDIDNDSLYVIPHNNSTYFEITGQLPDNNAPDSTYTPSVYGSTSWNPLGLRNGGDAIQVRAPDGSYWHGISYGGAEITGGPNNMKISTSGMNGNCGWFTDGDYLDASNWSTGSVGGNETPGLPNNPLNLAWLRAMRDTSSANCPITALPVELIKFEGEKTESGNYIYWQTASEVNSSYFSLDRSVDGKNWEEINTTSSAGNSQVEQHYHFNDIRFEETVNYYRLSQFDMDGSFVTYTKYVVIDNRLVPEVELVKIVNIIGQEIDPITPGLQVHIYSDGTAIKVYN